MADSRRLTRLGSDALGRTILPDGQLTVALSGGADSAALAWLAGQSGREVSALHVNHTLPGSPRMESAATNIASKLGIAIEVTRVELAEGPSPEAMARAARYEVLCGSVSQILTAHTADDNTETILINLIRGTGLTGLTGIPAHRPPNIWRPILDVTRSETREIASLAGLEFVDDPANADMNITRNRVRSRLMPALREFNPIITETLNQMAENLRGDADYLANAIPATPEGGLPTGLMLTLPEALADRLLISWLRRQGVVVSSSILARTWDVVRARSDNQELGNGAVLRRVGAVVEVHQVG